MRQGIRLTQTIKETIELTPAQTELYRQVKEGKAIYTDGASYWLAFPHPDRRVEAATVQALLRKGMVRATEVGKRLTKIVHVKPGSPHDIRDLDRRMTEGVNRFRIVAQDR